MYGIQLPEALAAGGVSPRRALALLRWLPQGSATHAMLAGERSLYEWTRPVAITADVYDSVMVNMVGTTMGKLKKTPDPYPRPKVRPAKEPTKPVASAREWAGMVTRQLAG